MSHDCPLIRALFWRIQVAITYLVRTTAEQWSEDMEGQRDTRARELKVKQAEHEARKKHAEVQLKRIELEGQEKRHAFEIKRLELEIQSKQIDLEREKQRLEKARQSRRFVSLLFCVEAVCSLNFYSFALDAANSNAAEDDDDDDQHKAKRKPAAP